MTVAPAAQRIFFLGHRSYAATGLVERLRQRGHTVITYHRGPTQRQGDQLTGSMLDMAEHPGLAEESADVLLNFALLKDDGVEPNEQYIDALGALAIKLNVKHLIHMSSISSFADASGTIREDSPEETDPNQKGSYGSIKVAQDRRLHQLFDGQQLGATQSLALIRPGFILGPGVVNPIIGTGIRLPWNRLIALGAAGHHLPVTTRDKVHEAIEKLIETPATPGTSVFVLADRDSPTRKQYLQACCEKLGTAAGVWSVPRLLWRIAGLGGECVARIVGMSLRPNRPIRAACYIQQFDPSKTESALGISCAVDWRSELVKSQEAQAPNFVLPFQSTSLNTIDFSRVNIIGCGRIVEQRHLPALRSKLKYAKPIAGYDLAAERSVGEIQVKPLGDFAADQEPGDALTVVATPGPVHRHALPMASALAGPMLIEKPLAMNRQELDQWCELASTRQAPITVCHNYRYKSNTRQLVETLQRYNPGRLIHARLDFHSPPAAFDGVPWLRRERESRTLLLDYAIHLVDIACMFSDHTWRLERSSFDLNSRGETAVIDARLESDAYPVELFLRQGFMPRRATIDFTFENYVAHLGFFPETFALQMGDLAPAFRKQQAKGAAKTTRLKIADRLLGRDHDDSHARLYAALGNPAGEALRVERLAGFYRGLFDLSDAVYGEVQSP